MKDKVYVIVEDWSSDGEHGVELNVFEDKREAIMTLKEMVIQAKKDNIFDTEDIEIDSLTPFYKGASSDFFDNDHYLIYLKEESIIRESNKSKIFINSR